MSDLIKEKDFKNIVEKAIKDAFEDTYYMDFECEGVEPTLYAENGSGDDIVTHANVYTDMLWSSGARPLNKKAKSYMEVAIDDLERTMDEYIADGDEEDEAYMKAIEYSREYEPFVQVIATPHYYVNDKGFNICDLMLKMNLVSYNGAKIVQYEEKEISFSNVTMNDRININYVSEDDFEFEGGGFPVEKEVIEGFIQSTILEYVSKF